MSAHNHRAHAEMTVIGAVVMRPDVLHKVQLNPYDFGDTTAARAWAAILAISDRGGEIDPITIESQANGKVSVEWILKATDLVATTENIDSYAGIVSDESLKRRIWSMAESLLNDKTKEMTGSQLLAAAQDSVEMIASGLESKGYYSANEIAHEIFNGLDDIEGSRGLLTGIDEWDMYAEMDRGDTMILGGDTSMGKSQVFGWMRARYIECGERVLLLSTESKRKKVGRRDLSYLTGINSRVIKRYEFNSMQLKDFGNGISQYSEWPFWVNDRIYDVDDACQFIRFMVARHGISVVQVDHLHELTAQGINNPQERFGYCIEKLAREAQHGEGLYMQAASQVTQDPAKEKRLAKLVDLYYSGRIRQVAQVVLMITRLAKYSNKADPRKITLRWEKVRDGETGMHDWRWNNEDGLLVGPAEWYEQGSV